ncbi:MAG: YkgJ family cysteine cluster protein [Chloroflexi bacterium]|nr:YkgJ family cysteine cluster protein [Chloroflexota bacterium]
MTFKCKEGCADCCGIIPLTKELIEKKDKFQVPVEKEFATKNEGKVLITKDMLCIFLNRETKKCSIYEDRPIICRRFGVEVDDKYQLACPYFKPNGNPWTIGKRKQIDRIQDKWFKKLENTK